MTKRELLQFCGDDIIKAYTADTRKTPSNFMQVANSLDLDIGHCTAIYSRYRKNFLPFVTLMNEMMLYDMNSILSGEFSSPYLEVIRVPKGEHNYQAISLLIILRKTPGVPARTGSLTHIGSGYGVFHETINRATRIQKEAVIFEAFPIPLATFTDGRHTLNGAYYQGFKLDGTLGPISAKRIARVYDDRSNNYSSPASQTPSVTLFFAFEIGWERNGISLDNKYCTDIIMEREYQARIMSYRTQGGLSPQERRVLFTGGEYAQYREISKLEYHIIKNLRNKTYDFIRRTKTLG